MVNGVTMPASPAYAGDLAAVQIQARIQAAVLVKQKEVTEQMGDLALKLIESAEVVGRRLDVTA